MLHNEKTAPARAASSLNSHHLHSKNRVDFQAINRVALGALPILLQRWLPDGRRVGCEWKARNPLRADNRAGSFSINMTTGRWADFATGDRGGDVVSLAAYLGGVQQIEAARKLAAMLGVRHD